MFLLKNKSNQLYVLLATFTIAVQSYFVGYITEYLGCTHLLGTLVVFAYMSVMYFMATLDNEPKLLKINCSSYFFGIKYSQIFITGVLSAIAMAVSCHYFGLNVGFGTAFLTNAITNAIITTYYALALRKLAKKYMDKY